MLPFNCEEVMDQNYKKNEISRMAERAKNIRKSQRMILEDVADITGLSVSDICKFEKGHSSSTTIADSLAEAYDVPLALLMFGQSHYKAIPYFLMGKGLYSKKFEELILSGTERGFPEILRLLSNEPAQEAVAANAIDPRINYEFAYQICKNLSKKREGRIRASKKRLRKSSVDIAFEKDLFQLPSFMRSDKKYNISDYFYYDDESQALKTVMPSWEFYGTESDENYIYITIKKEAWELIDWFETNTKGEK